MKQVIILIFVLIGILHQYTQEQIINNYNHEDSEIRLDFSLEQPAVVKLSVPIERKNQPSTAIFFVVLFTFFVGNITNYTSYFYFIFNKLKEKLLPYLYQSRFFVYERNTLYAMKNM